jgi:hypothetical protein
MPARFTLPRAALLVSALATACGGNAPEAKDAHQASPSDISVGDIVAAHGGFDALPGSKSTGVSETAPGTLRANLMDKDNPVKLDGVLGEWAARTPGAVVVKGSAGADFAFSAAVQYDDKFLYVGGDVAESSFVRTDHFGDGEDHASLVLAFPKVGGGFAGYEIGLFAGKPGESVGEVRYAGGRKGQVAGAKIVEAPTAKGYSFEAIVPWSTFPEARSVRVGLRGAVRYTIADGGGAAHNVVSTGPGDASSPANLPSLLTEAEQSIVDGILKEKGLTAEAPKVDILADLTGDGMRERVAVWGNFLTISGPTYRGGKEYFYRDIGGELIHIEARDVTGRGKDDLVLRRRLPVEGSTREWFEVWSLLKGDEPFTTFGHEIAITREGKRVSNAVRVAKKEIHVTLEPASGWDASSYREPTVDGVEPILLPWGPTRGETFRFDGTRFARVHEDRQTPTPGSAVVAPAPSQRLTEPATPTVVVNPPSRGPAEASGDLSAQVFAQYRRDHGVPAEARPKVDLMVDIDGDGRAERVVLLGKDIVVCGSGFKGGTQYAFLTLSQFDNASDLKDMSARDLTGDGGADLVVRGTRHVSAAGGGGAVEIDALLAYQVKSGVITRIFAIETGRTQGTRRAQGQVQFIPSKDGHGFEVDVRPGRVTGWTAKTYPWTQDTPGTGALEPLLLPWGGVPSLRYTWNGTAFTRP